MANTLKKSAASLKAIAAGEQEEDGTERPSSSKRATKKSKAIMIGAHFDPATRRFIALLQADPRNEGKQINDLLVEALNDLFAKYGVPQGAKLARDS